MQLVVHRGEPDEQVFVLRLGSTTIGRARECEVAIPNRRLSRHHTRLEYAGGDEVALVDLGSKNGTRVEGRRVEQCNLVAGSSFSCGGLVFTLTQG
jgi:pSer/pThr/pTyr-binding forkhead associated (FHA) protein